MLAVRSDPDTVFELKRLRQIARHKAREMKLLETRIDAQLREVLEERATANGGAGGSGIPCEGPEPPDR